LSDLGASLLVETLPRIASGQLEPVPQEESRASYAPMIQKQDGLVDFGNPAIRIERQIRAMNPWPGAVTSYEGQPMKLWQADVEEASSSEKPGTILSATSKGLRVATGGGVLNITEIQMPGKKKMPVGDYIRGNNIEIKRILG